MRSTMKQQMTAPARGEASETGQFIRPKCGRPGVRAGPVQAPAHPGNQPHAFVRAAPGYAIKRATNNDHSQTADPSDEHAPQYWQANKQGVRPSPDAGRRGADPPVTPAMEGRRVVYSTGICTTAAVAPKRFVSGSMIHLRGCGDAVVLWQQRRRRMPFGGTGCARPASLGRPIPVTAGRSPAVESHASSPTLVAAADAVAAPAAAAHPAPGAAHLGSSAAEKTARHTVRISAGRCWGSDSRLSWVRPCGTHIDMRHGERVGLMGCSTRVAGSSNPKFKW
jgi:hypothetical protein